MRLLKHLLAMQLAIGLLVGVTGCETAGKNNTTETSDINETIGTSEGSTDAPVEVTVESEHAGTVAALGASYYTLELTEPSDISLVVTTKTLGRLGITIFSDENLTNTVYEKTIENRQNVFSFSYIQFQTAGIYYIRLQSDTEEGLTYTMRFIRNTYYTGEGNITEPVYLELNTSHAASIGADGVSYYRFDADTTGYYDMVMIDPTYTYIPTVNVYSNADFTTAATSGNFGKSIVVTEPGTYYVAMHNNESRGVGFGLVAVYSKPPGGEGSVDEPVLLSPDEENTIALDKNFAGYYRFTVENDGYYTIDTGSLNATAYLYDDAAFTNELSTGSSSSKALITPLLTNGVTYYLKVISSYDSPSTLSVTPLNEGSADNPIAITLSTIHDGVVGGASDAHEYDSSYYSFTTGASGEYTIVLKSTMNTDFYLYNDHFETLNTPAVSSDYNGETAIVTLNGNTSYYVKVAPPATTTQAPSFTLRVLQTATTSDGSLGGPVPVTVGTPYGGGMTSTDKVSYYSFEVPVDQTVYNIFVTDVAHHKEKITLELYGDAAYTNKIDATDSGSSPLQLELNSTHAYIKALGATDLTDNLNYDIRVHKQLVNQGATNAPLLLTIDSDFNGSVGTSSELSRFSFYKVVLSEAGDYNFTATGDVGQLERYQQLGVLSDLKSGEKLRSTYVDTMTFTYRHTGSNSLYWMVQNNADDRNLTYTQNFYKTAPAEATNEGTVASPIDLGNGLSGYRAKTGTAAQLAETSRYRFATASGIDDGYYKITVANHSPVSPVYLSTYSDTGYTTQIGTTGSNLQTIPITAETTYYLTATENNYDIFFDLNITRLTKGSVSNPVAITIINTGLETGGVVGAYSTSSTETPDESFYSYSTSGGTEHSLSVTNVTGVTADRLTIKAYDEATYTNEINSSSERITFTSSAATIYFKVINYGFNNATYDLNVTTN